MAPTVKALRSQSSSSRATVSRPPAVTNYPGWTRAQSPYPVVRVEEHEPVYPNLQVLIIVKADDPRSRAALQELQADEGCFKRLREKGWRIGTRPDDNLRIVRADEVVNLVQKLKIETYPAVVAVHEGEPIRSFTQGCTTPLDEYTFAWLRTGAWSRPTDSQLEAVSVDWTGNYPLRGHHWSVDGDYAPSRLHVLQHLRGANHVALYPSDWPIETWSYEELRSLHDDLHESNQPRPLVASSPFRIHPTGNAPSR